MHSLMAFNLHTQGTIRDAIEDSITWPVRNIVPILPGDYRCANFLINTILIA